jgi:hypothetical protein
MIDQTLTAFRDLIQEDIGKRGLRTDPTRNLINAFPDDFANACRDLAGAERPAVAIVTGFYIVHGHPPAAETDGPPGALFLARVLFHLGFRVALLTDQYCLEPLKVGLRCCGLVNQIPVLAMPSLPEHWPQFLKAGWLPFARDRFRLTHLIALERVGPSHTLESLQAQLQPSGALGEVYLDFLHEVPIEDQDCCHNASGRDISRFTAPAHLLFESVHQELPDVRTIGIGDGGNEIGMGKIPWTVIRANIAGGSKIACRVPTHHLIVCGISNWGAYGLALGTLLLRGKPLPADFVSQEKELLQKMIELGPLVDGVTGYQVLSVDGIPFDRYLEPLQQMAAQL